MINLPLNKKLPDWVHEIGLIPLAEEHLVNSMWGNILLAEDGYLYISAGNHETFHSRTWLYRMNRLDRCIQPCLDLQKVFGKHADTFAVGDSKIHTRLLQADNGRIYFATMQGGIGHVSKLPHYLHPDQYPGGHLLEYNPAEGTCRDLGVPVRGEGLQSAALDRERKILYMVTWPKKWFVTYDLETHETQVHGLLSWSPTTPEGEKQNFGRDIMVAHTGKVYGINNYGRLLRFDPEKQALEDTDIPVREHDSLRTHVTASDGRIYFVTSRGHLFQLDPDSESVEALGPVTPEGPVYTPNLVLSPGEDKLTYLAGSHGTYLGGNLQLIEFDLAGRKPNRIGTLDGRFQLSYCYGSATDANGTVYFAIHGGNPASSYITIYDPAALERPGWIQEKPSNMAEGSGFFVGPGSEGQTRGWIVTDYHSLGETGKEGVPFGSDAIHSLVYAPHAGIYGATSAPPGKSGYLFHKRKGAKNIECLAKLSSVLESSQRVMASLQIGMDGHLYGGTIDLTESEFEEKRQSVAYPARLPEAYEGGNLFRFNRETGQLENLGIPVSGQGIYAMCSSPDGGIVYALTFPHAFLVAWDVHREEAQVVARLYAEETQALRPDEFELAMVRLMDPHEFDARKAWLIRSRGLEDSPASWPDEALMCKYYVSRSICCDDQGKVYGSHGEGRLFCYNPQTQDLEILDCRIPMAVGTEYGLISEPSISALVRGDDGWLYGGTHQDGYVFRFHPQRKVVANLGKPVVDNWIRGLAFWKDDLYGIVGEPLGKTHLFRFDRDIHSLDDLGVLQGGGRTGFAVNNAGSLCAEPEGALFVGQAERISCLLELNEVEYQPYQSP